MKSSFDFHPTANWPNLQLRADLLRRLREFFHARGFLEVETPILSADTVVDRHLDPFYVEVESGKSPAPSPPPPVPRLWLQTSPEFAMKRLLAAGDTSIYQVARVFRRDEIGPLHNPEFTLVEWYRAGDGMDKGMQLTSDLCEAMLARGPAERISYREAFQRHVGVDPHTAGNEELAAVVRACGIQPPASLAPDDRDGWLDLLLVERIQPHLGVERPALLFDFPASQAALARIGPDEPPVAERFELYVDGIELANGYHELLDPAELRARNSRVNAQRRADGKPALPEESRLLRAMESGLPPAVGVALGFDRLVMLAAGAKSIAEVVAFPFDRA
jgi:elongation factor P--(R)-beta-lysine ligase